MEVYRQARYYQQSPSSRRAWIEIVKFVSTLFSARVALLAEGVDRNLRDGAGVRGDGASPSSRRAWIEIPIKYLKLSHRIVALLAEGVDRNFSKSGEKMRKQ